MELQDLKIDRVDGVDQPATGLRFLIVKAADPKSPTLEEVTKSADAFAAKVKSYFAKMHAVTKGVMPWDEDDQATTDRTDFMKAIGAELAFKKKDAPDIVTPGGAQVDPTLAGKEPEKVDIAKAVGEAVAAHMTTNLAPVLKSLDGLGARLGAVETGLTTIGKRPNDPPASRQPAGGGKADLELIEKRELGKGKFVNVVFPDA